MRAYRLKIDPNFSDKYVGLKPIDERRPNALYYLAVNINEALVLKTPKEAHELMYELYNQPDTNLISNTMLEVEGFDYNINPDPRKGWGESFKKAADSGDYENLTDQY